MSVVPLSRFTIPRPSGEFWQGAKETFKESWNVIFGFLCFGILTVMGTCCSTRISHSNKKDDDEVTTPEETDDLESQRTHEPTGPVVQTGSTEATRTAETHPHTDENGRQSIGKRSREADLADTSNPVAVQHENDLLSHSPKKIKQSEPSPIPSASDDGTLIRTPRKTSLLSIHGTGEASSSKTLRTDAVIVTPPHQQVVFESPVSSRTNSIQSAISNRLVTESKGRAAQVKPSLDGSSVAPKEQHRRNEAEDVNDGARSEVNKPAPNVPFAFPNETSRRSFMSRADAYTEKEIISWTKSLASRMSTLSAYLIKEVARCKPGSNERRTETGGTDRRVGDLLKRGLGARLYAELAEAGQKGEEVSIDDISATVHDSLDAWGTFCIHLAMKPILFGLSPRTIDDIESIFRQMADHEQELAQCWKQVRYHEIPVFREIDPWIPQLVEDVSIVQRMKQKDKEEYAMLEQTFHRDLVNSEYGRQFAMHWRGLLQKYEVRLPSYRAAISRTKDAFTRGILQIFSLACVEPPQQVSFQDKVEKIVHDAAALAERTRTGVFSQTAELVIVEPGRPFDSGTMVSAEGDGNEVKCTLQFGLEVVGCEGQQRLLVQPEVLVV